MRLYIEGHTPSQGYAICRNWSEEESSKLPIACDLDLMPIRYVSNIHKATALVNRYNRRFATHGPESKKDVSSHPDLAKPLQTLSCCCCGGYFTGRQFHNQDTGFGLGPCCLDYVKPRVEDIERTYGVFGVHYMQKNASAQGVSNDQSVDTN